MHRILLLLVCVYTVRSEEVCCPDAGCFNDDPPFDGLPMPECAEVIQIDMTVYTRANPEGQIITRTTIPPAFDGSKLTIFIVHGWLGSSNNNWMHVMKDDLLAQGDYNAIIVGWAGSSQQIWYPQSASDTRTVGTEIGLVSENVIARGGSDNSRLYCVGHSLGSHVCGHAGTRETLGRITGMDPAGPLFENRDWTCGLNPSCATVVDVMHTNGEANLVLNLGTMKILGHVDFFPNGGGLQPECVLDPLRRQRNSAASNEEVQPMADLTPACSHMRAIDYYIESVLTPCFVSRHQCSDQYNLPGSCTTDGSVVQSMGLDSINYSARGIFYLTTNGAEPFCQG